MTKEVSERTESTGTDAIGKEASHSGRRVVIYSNILIENAIGTFANVKS